MIGQMPPTQTKIMQRKEDKNNALIKTPQNAKDDFQLRIQVPKSKIISVISEVSLFSNSVNPIFPDEYNLFTDCKVLSDPLFAICECKIFVAGELEIHLG